MILQTSRFGKVSADAQDIITFPEGILGFVELKKFVLLDDPSDEIFAWLQSAEEPTIAFPVLEPEIFQADYKINLAKADYDVLKTNQIKETRIFTIITIPEDPTRMTANLKAPIVINLNAQLARQCVLQDNNFAIKDPIFTKLQQRLVQNPLFKTKQEGLHYVKPMAAAQDKTPEKNQSPADKDFSAEV